MTTGPAGPSWPTVVWARRSPTAENRRRSRSANAGSSSAPTPGSTATAGCAAAPSGGGAASRPISPWPPPSSPCALCFEPPGTATAGTPGQDHRASADLLADALTDIARSDPGDDLLNLVIFLEHRNPLADDTLSTGAARGGRRARTESDPRARSDTEAPTPRPPAPCSATT